MLTRTLACTALALWAASGSSHAELLPNNFWPNSDFEDGINLDDPVGGTLNQWNRGGSDATICHINTKAFSGSHSLSVVDANNQFGEFYCDVSLAGRAAPGDKIDLRWQEIHQINTGEMRVTLVFLDSSGALTGAKHFVKRGTSQDFGNSLEEALWVQRDETADIPEGTTTLRVSLVSGGALSDTGIYLIDELSVARHPSPILLPNNVWANNPTFEEGENLDQPNGTLTAWNRGGSGSDICQISTENFISPSHALAVVDTDNRFGEWYSDLPLAGVAKAGDELNLQWFELFNVSAGGEMRVTVLALSGSGSVLDAKHYVARGQSAGWNGTAASSPFVKRNEKLTLPEGAATLRVSLVSGGSLETTGFMIVDDVSINKSAPALPEVLAGNVWQNPGFEEGTDLDSPAGTLVGWNRGGNAPAVCVILADNSVSPTHSLAVLDDTDSGYGEWYSNLRLGASTAGGRLLNLQWFELFNIPEGEMRLSLVYFNGANAVLAQSHFVARGNSSGWKTTAADSTFVRRNEQTVVPVGATRLQISLVSGGPLSAKGLMAIDNLSVAPAPTAPEVLFGNIATNPGFEEGTDLDNPATGKPTGWARGGGDTTINQVLTSAFQSSTHALAVVDENASNFGEWYRSYDLTGGLAPGDEVAVQWWEMFSVSPGGEMRLSILCFDAANQILDQKHFVTRGDSAGWAGSVPVSFFTKRNEQFTLPPRTTRFMVTLTSGGPLETTGVMVIDDLSFARPLPPPDLLPGNFWANSTFEEGVQLDNPTVGVPTGWSRGGSFIRGNRVNNEIGTSPTHSLELRDDQDDSYSEWYQFWNFGDKLRGGDLIEAQWFWVYDTVGDMRLSWVWFDAQNNIVNQNHYVVHGQSPEFTGDINTSPFERRLHQIRVPDTAVRALMSFASGGALSAKGRIILDDLSVRVIPFRIEAISPIPEGWLVTWESVPERTYQVQSSDSLAPDSFEAVPGAESIPGDGGGASTSIIDGRPGASARYYRVIVVPPGLNP